MSGKSHAEDKLELLHWLIQANPQALAHVKESIEEYERNLHAKTMVVGYRSRGHAVDWAQLETNLDEALKAIEQGRGRSLEIIEHESDTW
ncbi:MAG: hypothetical protein ACKO66_05390 [Flavobacteriales bacterium]